MSASHKMMNSSSCGSELVRTACCFLEAAPSGLGHGKHDSFSDLFIAAALYSSLIVCEARPSL